jgi:hypothetical protein
VLGEEQSRIRADEHREKGEVSDRSREFHVDGEQELVRHLHPPESNKRPVRALKG